MAECKGVCRFGAKEVLIVGGNGGTEYGDWARNKRNYLIGQS